MTQKIDIEKIRYKRGPGRPPVESPMKQIAIRLPDDLLAAIDVVIDEREGQTDRAAVIREMIAKGLKVGE